MTTYKNFKINAKFQGFMIAPNFNETKARPKYFVYVTNTDTNEKTRFTFWDSIKACMDCKEELSESEELEAFYCFVSDALSGCNTFSDFCSEFGYDEDSRSAYRIYTACKRSCKSWERVSGMDEGETCDFLNELQEIAG